MRRPRAFPRILHLATTTAALLSLLLPAPTHAELCSNGLNTLRDLGEELGVSIGVGTRIDYLQEYPEQAALVKKEFNMIATDDELKMNIILHPHDLQYDFTKLDAMVDFATDNDLRVRGHTLFYHLAIPDKLRDWDLTQAEWRAWAQEYLCTVMGRYKGRIQEYDVVNEVFVHPEFPEDGVEITKPGLRDTFFKQKLGDDYIQFLFTEARKCDPDAKLYLNDFLNEHQNGKLGYMLPTIQQWVKDGVPIDGVGMQAHVSYFHDSNTTYSKTFQQYHEAGLLQAFTEFDAFHLCEDDPDFPEHQAMIYYTLVRLALKYRESFKSIVVWAVNDNFSWVKNNPLFPCKGSPTLFDKDNMRKPSYYAFHRAMCEAAGGTPGDDDDTPIPTPTPGDGDGGDGDGDGDGDDGGDGGGGDGDDANNECFPADAAVAMADGTTRAMRDLEIGDVVQTTAGAAEVFLFTHRSRAAVSEFVQLVAGNATLTATASHYILAPTGLVAAGDVSVGDYVLTGDARGVAAVDEVRRVRKVGLYAPHTTGAAGTLVVDGFVVSEYTQTVHPVVAKALLAPLRAMYRAGVGAVARVPMSDGVRKWSGRLGMSTKVGAV